MKSILYRKLCRRTRRSIRIQGRYYCGGKNLLVVLIPDSITCGDDPLQIVPEDEFSRFQVVIKHRYWYSIMRDEYFKLRTKI